MTSIKSDTSLLILTYCDSLDTTISIEFTSLQRQCYKAFLSEYYVVHYVSKAFANSRYKILRSLIASLSNFLYTVSRNNSNFKVFDGLYLCYIVGYVIPVISYASPTWFANETETKSIERINKSINQRNATSWTLRNSSKSYKGQKRELKLLPLYTSSNCMSY